MPSPGKRVHRKGAPDAAGAAFDEAELAARRKFCKKKGKKED